MFNGSVDQNLKYRFQGYSSSTYQPHHQVTWFLLPTIGGRYIIYGCGFQIALGS